MTVPGLPIRLNPVSPGPPFTVPARVKWGTLGILQALVHSHDIDVEALDESDKLSEVLDGCRVQVMHNDEISSSAHVSEERITLSLRRFALCP